jgi:transcriptional regulator with XRE-family HTH domain
MSIITTVRLDFAHRLKNKVFRRKFFKSSAQDTVAARIRELRKQRGMKQADLAKAARMKQSAVSRIEQAEYSRWGFNTLTRIADALDARVRIVFEPAEEVIEEYGRQERQRALLADRFERSRKQAAGLTAVDQLGIAQTDGMLIAATGSPQELGRAATAPTGQSRQGASAPGPVTQAGSAGYLQ